MSKRVDFLKKIWIHTVALDRLELAKITIIIITIIIRFYRQAGFSTVWFWTINASAAVVNVTRAVCSCCHAKSHVLRERFLWTRVGFGGALANMTAFWWVRKMQEWANDLKYSNMFTDFLFSCCNCRALYIKLSLVLIYKDIFWSNAHFLVRVQSHMLAVFCAHKKNRRSNCSQTFASRSWREEKERC